MGVLITIKALFELLLILLLILILVKIPVVETKLADAQEEIKRDVKRVDELLSINDQE